MLGMIAMHNQYTISAEGHTEFASAVGQKLAQFRVVGTPAWPDAVPPVGLVDWRESRGRASRKMWPVRTRRLYPRSLYHVATSCGVESPSLFKVWVWRSPLYQRFEFRGFRGEGGGQEGEHGGPAAPIGSHASRSRGVTECLHHGGTGFVWRDTTREDNFCVACGVSEARARHVRLVGVYWLAAF
jgi:hypothetical protein